MNEYRNHNNAKVDGDELAVVSSRELLRKKIELHDELWQAGRIKQIQGECFWLTTVQEAMQHGLTCAVYSPRYGILNSIIYPNRQAKGV